MQQIGVLLGKTAEAARVTAQLARRRDEASATQRARSAPPTVLFEYCVCTQYDPDPDRRVANPALYHSGWRAPGARLDPAERRCTALHPAWGHREVDSV